MPEHCARCDDPTGRAGAGDDSLYMPDGAGPYCQDCYDDIRGERPTMPHADQDVTARALAAVEAARARADEATPGPWEAISRMMDYTPNGAWEIRAYDEGLEEDDLISGACVVADRAPWGHYTERSLANATFIAHARADIPLLAAIAAAVVVAMESAVMASVGNVKVSDPSGDSVDLGAGRVLLIKGDDADKLIAAIRAAGEGGGT